MQKDADENFKFRLSAHDVQFKIHATVSHAAKFNDLLLTANDPEFKTGNYLIRRAFSGPPRAAPGIGSDRIKHGEIYC
jgi:hypothetical protein